MPEERGRLLALDLGAKRVGVAVSDELHITTRPLPPLARGSWKKLLASVAQLTREFEAVGLVLGLPLNLDGTEGFAAQEARRLARNFGLSLKIPVHLQDERLTSREAGELLGLTARPDARQRAQIDSLAAALILRDFIAWEQDKNNTAEKLFATTLVGRAALSRNLEAIAPPPTKVGTNRSAILLEYMNLEIEKKYRVSQAESAALRVCLDAVGATALGEEFEENTLYGGNNLDTAGAVLRLRRVGGRAVLTYKRRFVTASAIKHNIEHETIVADAGQMAALLEALGYDPILVYEKRRATWHWGTVEIVLDELPFGLFVEIEGPEDAIIAAEKALQLVDTEAVHETYPHLAAKHGTRRGGLVEARFGES